LDLFRIDPFGTLRPVFDIRILGLQSGGRNDQGRTEAGR
jgi:hypothetical protein